MIRFAIMLRSKLNLGTYQFVTKAFNLPSSRSVSNYDLVDSSTNGGISFGVLRMLGARLKQYIVKLDYKDAKKSNGCEWEVWLFIQCHVKPR